MTTETGGIDESKIGANASAEEGADALQEESVTQCNIVTANRLQKTAFSNKKDYQNSVKVKDIVNI